MNGFFLFARQSAIKGATFFPSHSNENAHSKQFLFHYVEMQTTCYTKHDEIEKGEKKRQECVYVMCVFSQQRKWK